jgi:hypothetical protein
LRIICGAWSMLRVLFAGEGLKARSEMVGLLVLLVCF